MNGQDTSGTCNNDRTYTARDHFRVSQRLLWNWHDFGITDALIRVAKTIAVPKWAVSGSLDSAVSDMRRFCPTVTRRDAVLYRIYYGKILEDHANKLYTRIKRTSSSNDTSVLARVSFDAYAVALWTSAHVEYLYSLSCGLLDLDDVLLVQILASTHMLDVSDLFERVCFNQRNYKELGNECGVLARLIERCMGPGVRGWNVAATHVDKSPATRTMLNRELKACFCGLHAQLDPTKRPSIFDRFVLLRQLSQCKVQNTDNKQYTRLLKETTRRLVASSLNFIPATHHALTLCKHTASRFKCPPCDMVHDGMQRQMNRIAECGTRIADECRRMSKPVSHNDFLKIFTDAVTPWETASVTHNWLSKDMGRTSRRGNAQTLLNMTQLVSSVAYKHNFVPFWLFAQSHGVRTVILDDVQHDAIHSLNTVNGLVNTLSNATMLLVQRIVLQNPRAALQSVECVVKELQRHSLLDKNKTDALHTSNFFVRPTLQEKQTHVHSQKALNLFAQHYASILGGVQSDGYRAALLISYAKVAAACGIIKIIDLGERVAGNQRRAIRNRIQRTTLSSTDDVTLPGHATHAYICRSCKRIANAFVDNNTIKNNNVTFNEFGVFCSQLQTCKPVSSDVEEVQASVHCAKRLSAVARTAKLSHDNATSTQIEQRPVDAAVLQTTHCMSDDRKNEMNLRRDVRYTFSHNSASTWCGMQPMLSVPIIGRMINVFDKWYTVCTFCGAMMQFRRHVNWYGSDICCMACDPSLFQVNSNDNSPTCPATNVVCRMCFTQCNTPKALKRWKRVCAPLDVACENATLPDPLRKVWYCPKHYKPWVVDAHKYLETRIILSHLAHNCQPVDDHSGDQNSRGARERTQVVVTDAKGNDNNHDNAKATAAKLQKARKRKRAMYTLIKKH